MYVCMHACVRACVRVHACMHACVHVRMDACVHAGMYVVHAYIYTYVLLCAFVGVRMHVHEATRAFV